MGDRRIEMRKKLMAFTPVRDQERGILLGYLGDLTYRGLLVVGEKPLDVQTQITLEILFPDELPDLHARKMSILARVARCAKEEESLRDYNIGFEFVDLKPEQTQLIQALLNRYHFRHSVSE